jgi:DNA topoisomerase-1
LTSSWPIWKEKIHRQAITKKERRRKPPAPYITSKLQQDAANRLGFTSSKTMMIAQQLYEGIELTGEGPVGLITYMRTDSTRISPVAINAVRGYIASNFSQEYLPASPNEYSNKKGAQDAHEAIRPSDVLRHPDDIKKDLTRDQYRLYSLIWKRFVASQMNPEVALATSVSLQAGECEFRANGSIVLFDGFTVVDKDDKTKKETLPDLKEGDEVQMKELLPEQHFTTPPPRYNDASLVKFLEESGIGRPSTYAPTINTLIKRYYVTRSGRQLVPTILGRLVNDIMVSSFGSLISIDFTANMEAQLDKIEESKSDWVGMLKEFYEPFKHTVDDAAENIQEMKNVLDEQTDIVCEKCGRMMVKKLGKFGFFLAAPDFPSAATRGRSARALPGGELRRGIVKRSSKRAAIYACTNYPTCTFITRDVPTGKECPKCGGVLFSKRVKGKGELLLCLNEKCDYQVELLDE